MKKKYMSHIRIVMSLISLFSKLGKMQLWDDSRFVYLFALVELFIQVTLIILDYVQLACIWVYLLLP